ncbi:MULTISPECIES: hypothetical protein [unclassified Streptomyces]|uniref:hypothetical protein n=1 Tax=unclassified Streptomyces TaxID=2593676 RepID=UPI0024412391|nr:hypothetical protein [Streptomyces sp. DH41]MDG9725465.1 hypothetical protein [Streptomyces sp. DH41]
MGRGGAPRPGAAARRFRFTHARLTHTHATHERTAHAHATHRRLAHARIAPALLVFAPALPTAALATACGSGNPGTNEAGPTAATEATAPAVVRRTPSPARWCTSTVGHWAREMPHDGEPYGDYQSMGLSNRQYDILREVMEAARATKRHQGVRAAEELTDRQVRAACAEQYREGGPSDGPWQ